LWSSVLSIPVNPAYNFSITLPEITIVSKGMVAGQADKIAETGTSPLIKVVYFSLLSLFMLFFTVQLLRYIYRPLKYLIEGQIRGE